MISDILPHLGKDQAKGTRDEFFPAEDLDVLAWTTYAQPAKDAKPGDAPKADKKGLVAYLKKTYKVDEEDLLSAELEIVPAGMPREVGLDRALIAAYGHDDRVCSFAGLKALLDAADTVPERTASIIMCDKEEVGSTGSTGMCSSFFENTVAELIDRQKKNARDIDVRRALERSSMLSADVTAAADPHFPDVDSTGNSSAASILPQIKLEIGPIAEWFPQEPRSITPYAAEQYPDKFASRPQGIKKILSQTLGLPFVKPITIRQVGGGLFQNLNLHLIRSRTACLASAIFRKRDEPSEIRISRTHRTSACHAGEGTFEALRDRSTQISSIASILSVVLISLRGITSCIRTSKFSKA